MISMTSANSARHLRPNACERRAAAGIRNLMISSPVAFFHPIRSPSGKMRVLAIARAAFLLPRRLLPLRLLPLRSLRLRSLPLRLLSLRSLPLRSLPLRLLPLRLLPRRSLPLRLLPLRLLSLRSLPLRSLSLRSLPRRLLPLRLLPLRSLRLRSLRLRLLPLRSLPLFTAASTANFSEPNSPANITWPSYQDLISIFMVSSVICAIRAFWPGLRTGRGCRVSSGLKFGCAVVRRYQCQPEPLVAIGFGIVSRKSAANMFVVSILPDG